MAELEDRHASIHLQLQQCSSPFLEVNCTSSGKLRRFSAGTEAGFALQLINQKLESEIPEIHLASHIEAFKEGEEPISFGPNSALIDYGDGWKLRTVTNEVSEKQRILNSHGELPSFNEPIRDNDDFFNNVQLQLVDPLQEVDKPVASETISEIESQPETLDLTETFTTDEVFNTRDELIKWTRDVGKSVGTVIVIKKSGTGLAGRTPRIAFACERGGKYRVAKRGGMKMLPRRHSGTKKCGCPFALRGIKLPKDDQWKVKVEHGFHNHPLNRHSEGHSYGGKLTPEEEAIVLELSRSGMKPREVLNVLKERDSHNATTMHTIYGVRQKLKLTRKSITL